MQLDFCPGLRRESLYDGVMSLGKRGPDEKQEPIWIEAARLATPAGHPFYERLNRLLSKRGFDAFAESACESFYAKVGRPGLAAGSLLSRAAGRVFRGHRFGARHCMADSRLAGVAVVSGL